MDVRIEPVAAPTSEVTTLLVALDATLDAAYEPHQRHGLALDELFRPDIRFFVARLNGAAAGCGGLALFDRYAEVKRMYVHEATRGRGVAKALLADIEAAARAAAKPVLCVETGIHQIAAIRLYEGWGFRPRGPFGHYAGLPPDRIAASLFYEKLL